MNRKRFILSALAAGIIAAGVVAFIYWQYKDQADRFEVLQQRADASEKRLGMLLGEYQNASPFGSFASRDRARSDIAKDIDHELDVIDVIRQDIMLDSYRWIPKKVIDSLHKRLDDLAAQARAEVTEVNKNLQRGNARSFPAN